MPLPIIRYPLDPTGLNPDNRVIGELHTTIARPIKPIAPTYGAYFTESLSVYDNSTDRLLIRGTDYQCTELLQEATLRYGKEISLVVLITNPNVSENIRISYQVLGGLFQNSAKDILGLYEAAINDNRPVDWVNILNRPTEYPPSLHMHFLEDMVGFEPVVAALERVKNAIVLGNIPAFEALIDHFDAQIKDQGAEVSKLEKLIYDDMFKPIRSEEDLKYIIYQTVKSAMYGTEPRPILDLNGNVVDITMDERNDIVLTVFRDIVITDGKAKYKNNKEILLTEEYGNLVLTAGLMDLLGTNSIVYPFINEIIQGIIHPILSNIFSNRIAVSQYLIDYVTQLVYGSYYTPSSLEVQLDEFYNILSDIVQGTISDVNDKNIELIYRLVCSEYTNGKIVLGINTIRDSSYYIIQSMDNNAGYGTFTRTEVDKMLRLVLRDIVTIEDDVFDKYDGVLELSVETKNYLYENILKDKLPTRIVLDADEWALLVKEILKELYVIDAYTRKLIKVGKIENLPVVTPEDIIQELPVRKYVTYDTLIDVITTQLLSNNMRMYAKKDTVKEGTLLGVYIDSIGIDNDSAYYWTIHHITTSDNDFSMNAGKVVINDNTGYFNTLLYIDDEADMSETFKVYLHKTSPSGPIISTTGIITVEHKEKIDYNKLLINYITNDVFNPNVITGPESFFIIISRRHTMSNRSWRHGVTFSSTDDITELLLDMPYMMPSISKTASNLFIYLSNNP